MRFDGPESALRMLHWRKGRVRDITVRVDRAARTVIGHASGKDIYISRVTGAPVGTTAHASVRDTSGLMSRKRSANPIPGSL
jgi:hypothetical protein